MSLRGRRPGAWRDSGYRSGDAVLPKAAEAKVLRPAGFARIPRWFRRTCATRPIRGCWPRRSADRGAGRGSSLHAALSDDCGFVAGRRYEHTDRRETATRANRVVIRSKTVCADHRELAVLARSRLGCATSAGQCTTGAAPRGSQGSRAGPGRSAGRRRGTAAWTAGPRWATCRSYWRRPRGSSDRPGNGSPGPPRTQPAGWSACTTAMPGRSRKAGVALR